MRKFNISSFVSKLVSLSPRQGKNENKTADFIISVLENYQINYYTQKFEARIPKIKAILWANNEKIKCEGCSFLSGKIEDKDYIVSSLIGSQLLINQPNINFNPKCKAISLSNFYFAPSIAINCLSLEKIIKAKSVKGKVIVSPYVYTSSNILVGSIRFPKNILFAHYDSIKKGAIDNASGVSVLMKLIIENPNILKDSLIVFSGSEELSYDYPIYWGYGYREFEKKYNNLLKKSKKIFVVDCVGNSKTVIDKDKKLLLEGFPIKNLKELKGKILFIHGDIEKLMQVYHSDLDTVSGVREEYILKAIEMVLSNLE